MFFVSIMKSFLERGKELHLRSIGVGLLCFLVMSAISGVLLGVFQRECLSAHGISLSGVSNKEIGVALDLYCSPEWLIVLSFLRIISVLVSSFVAGRCARQATFINGVSIGVVGVVVSIGSGAFEDPAFSNFTGDFGFWLLSLLGVIGASVLGGYWAARAGD